MCIRDRFNREIRSKDDCLHQRFNEAIGVARHWNRNACRFPNAVVLSNENVKHDLVDAIVFAVQGDRLNCWTRLAKAIDTTFTLLMSCWVPCEVVVNDRIECVLKIDPFGETVSCDEDTLALAST